MASGNSCTRTGSRTDAAVPITPIQAVLFALLGVMVLVWFHCVSKLSAQLKERHGEKYDEMGLDRMWPKNLAGWLAGHNNTKPVLALLRFLWRREDVDLKDMALSDLASFMRTFAAAYLALFSTLVYSIVTMEGPLQRRNGADVSSSIEYRREQLFVPYREKRYADAIAAYDALQPESGRDAELTYWRGMAYWQLGNSVQALQDFRRTIELDPANFNAHRYADRIMSREQRWDEILEMWNRYMEILPANADAYFERGGTNYHKGNLAAARADVARACELGKHEACAWAERLKPRP